MSTLRDGASPSDKARKLVAELVEVSDKYHNGTHAKSWQIWAVNEIANALAAAAPSLHKEGAGGERAISRETLEKLFDEYVPLRPMHPEAKGYMFEMLTAELNEAASPAGRAEQPEGK